ncbi:MAG TPA: hypothetical protein VJT73_09265 [Polyangiaceae bacterium]|nr:hypothetical protein [Polyangiaceae bacterium]
MESATVSASALRRQPIVVTGGYIAGPLYDWTEKETIARSLKCSLWAGLVVLVTFGLGYGLWRAHRPDDIMPFLALGNVLGNVVSLMHFWYDGFVRSVRKGHV